MKELDNPVTYYMALEVVKKDMHVFVVSLSFSFPMSLSSYFMSLVYCQEPNKWIKYTEWKNFEALFGWKTLRSAAVTVKKPDYKCHITQYKFN